MSQFRNSQNETGAHETRASQYRIDSQSANSQSANSQSAKKSQSANSQYETLPQNRNSQSATAPQYANSQNAKSQSANPSQNRNSQSENASQNANPVPQNATCHTASMPQNEAEISSVFGLPLQKPPRKIFEKKSNVSKKDKLKKEKIDNEDFNGETNRELRKVERRAISLSAAVLAYLRAKSRRLLRETIGEIKTVGKVLKVRKAKTDGLTPEQKRFLRVLTYFGIRQISDSGKEFAGSRWLIKPEFVSNYLENKILLIQQLDSQIEKEFKETVSSALGTWLEEDPQPTVNQISQRLRTWLTVPNSDVSPRTLKPLGNKFTVGGLGSRARMIARTEINAARNYGRVEAGKLTGRNFLLWIASQDGKSGDRHHEALDGQIVEQGKFFENPITGAKLRYPGDPKADSKFGVAGEVINCRCSVRPVSAEVAALYRK
mgnify:FL=1